MIMKKAVCDLGDKKSYKEEGFMKKDRNIRSFFHREMPLIFPSFGI